MKKLFIILFGLIVVTAMGGCLDLGEIFPFFNQAPVIISEPIITATEDQLYLYQVEASDPNGDTLTYSFIIKTEGMSIDCESGLISWTPTNNQVGIIHRVVVEVSDSKQSDTQSFEIEVINVNNPPQILSYSPANLNIEINEGNSVKFEVQAHDIDLNTTLSFQWFLNGRLVSNSTVSENDSKNSWIYFSGYGDYSQKRAEVLVSDGELQDYVQWSIKINDIIPPTQPTLNTVTSPTNIPTQTLSGVKESYTSIWINGAEVISINSDTTWSHPYNLSEGNNSISITSRDVVGNESLSTTNNITLDTISPMVPTLNSIISPTNISTQILGGTKEADTSILINRAEVIPINSKITWSYNLHLTERTNNIFITSCDTAGNESYSVSTIIVLDISTPEIPTLNDVISPTNISLQILSGTKESNTSIWINGTEVVSLNSSTEWSYSYNLSEGTNSISITSRDAAGNESSAVTAIILLDKINPVAPTLDTVVSPTNISPQILSGTKEPNTSIWINNIEVIPVNSSTNWTYDFNLSEGENNISVTSRDSTENESGKATAKIILDTISPATPNLNEVITPTNISIQVLSGSKEDSSSIWLNGTEVVSLNSSTEWSYSYNLSEGTNSISITSRDAAGNESSAVTAIILLDKINPAVPTLDAVISPTNISPQIFSGTKDTNTSIWINNIEVIPVNSKTTWTYDFNLSEGENNISIASQDSAGNESGKATAKIILDTISPATPNLNEVITPTNISIQVLSGSKEDSSSIWLNGTEVVSLNSSTEWSYSYNLSEGTNSISITSRDAAGNESSAALTTIEYDLNIYVDEANISGIEDGTETHPFNSITEGIDAATPGKSVLVAAGTYKEQLIINKGITLQGAGKESTTISVLELMVGYLITVTADDVTISGFTIDGGLKTDVGIYSDLSSSIEISKNIIKSHKDSGILYHRASGDYPSGIYVYDNDIFQNSLNGIKVTGAGSGIIEVNRIRNNNYGIKASNDASLEVKKNNIHHNSDSGIFCRHNSSLLIWGNEITFNSYDGIRVGEQYNDTTNPDIGGGGRGGIGRNNITGNTSHGVSNMTNHNISAKYNWWGDVAGPKYPGNPNGNAGLLSDWAYWSETGGNIEFDPYLKKTQTF